MIDTEIKVEITQRAIDRALIVKDVTAHDWNPACWCPTAQAIRSATGDDMARIGFQTQSEHQDEGFVALFADGARYWLPDEVGQFIADFDRGKTVKPFTFKMRKLE